jgi:hypothetical protein
MESQRSVAGTSPDGSGSEAGTDEPTVSVHQTGQDRLVFTEGDNRDGWIATDLAVELRR